MFRKEEKMKINAFQMLPFAKSLLQFLQTAITEGALIINDEGYVKLDEKSIKELLSNKLVNHMRDWKPEYNGKELLDENTRLHGARFLSGIAYSLLKEK
tara:strand:+ start:32 stop:328 length:297 start_codon:yes stop_codon:yes gene_type:complete